MRDAQWKKLTIAARGCVFVFFAQGEPGFLGPQGEPGLPGLPGTKVGDFSSSLWCCLSQRGRYFLLRVTRSILRAGNDETQTLWLMVITSYQPDRRWNREFLWVSVLITLHYRFPLKVIKPLLLQNVTWKWSEWDNPLPLPLSPDIITLRSQRWSSRHARVIARAHVLLHRAVCSAQITEIY